MPSVTLRYDITDDFRAALQLRRDAASSGFHATSIPNFALTDDLTNIGYGTGTGGNPDLEAAKSQELRPHARVVLRARQRHLRHAVPPRYRRPRRAAHCRRITIPGTGLNTDDFVVTQPVNASDGELEGIELGFLYFPELPGVFNGLGVQGSFTKLDSSQNIPQTRRSRQHHRPGDHGVLRRLGHLVQRVARL